MRERLQPPGFEQAGVDAGTAKRGRRERAHGATRPGGRVRRHPLTILSAVACLIGLALVTGGRVSSSAATFAAKPGSQQGVATDGRYTWVSSDDGGGRATVATYTIGGEYVGTSAALPIGHGAAIAFRVADGHLYAANGGLSTEPTSADTKVFALALDERHVVTRVTRTYDFSWLGRNGLVTIDNQTDTMAVMGGPDAGPWQIAVTRFPVLTRTTSRRASRVVRIRDPHVVLQGLGETEGRFYVYVTVGSSRKSRIDVFTASGRPVAREIVPFSGEAEGLAIDPRSDAISFGSHGPNEIHRLAGRAVSSLL